jgi:hypothetical protein
MKKLILTMLTAGALSAQPNQTTSGLFGLANLAELRLNDFEYVGIVDQPEHEKDLEWCEQLKAIVRDYEDKAINPSQAHWLIEHRLGVMNEKVYAAFLASGSPIELVLAGIELDPTGAANLARIPT